ncbi:MAG: FAD:protein FMN transferase [Nitrospirales bacterium]
MSCSSTAQGTDPLQFAGKTMGTTYQVTIVRPSSPIVLTTVQSHTDEILARINASMSTYQPDSELSRFNRESTTEWVPISSDLYFVVKEALRVSHLTEGAFDVSVGPIVDLWGFGPSPRQDTIPSDEAIQARLESIGYEHLHLQDDPPALRKDQPTLSVDLSAIAKGYGVDQIAEYLESLHVTNYLIEIGGELRASGHNAQGMPWNVAIEQPAPTSRRVHQVLHLDRQGIATSGDYRNFFEREGTRFSHTMNPKTGRPVTHKLSSVTVIAESSMKADALATALLVLGPDDGFALAQREQVASLFLTIDAEGFHEQATSGFAQYAKSSEL